MSLFKTKRFWSNQCSTDEEFDHNSLKVSRLNGNFDYVLIGSHSGIIRIYKPDDGITNESVFNPNDLLLEKCLTSVVLQVEVGKFVSGSPQNQIAVLHPRSLVVFSFISKEGIAVHGTENILSFLYEHKLQRSAANFVIGPFGGVQNRDFICVQTLDGLLIFFEQENLNFSCSLPDFLLPGPLVYVKSSDSFVTSGSDWCLQSYRYKTLSEVGQTLRRNEVSDKKICCDWSYNMGENVLDIRSLYDDTTRQSFTTILGERNLYCFSDSGRLKFLKRLDFCPSCFFMYYSDNGKLTTLVVSETNTLLIYHDVTLKWSAKLHFLPVSISRAFFKEVPGALVMLAEDGYLEFAYLGTEPNLFSAPPLKNQELDFEKTESELSTLNKLIKSTLNNDIKLANSDVDKDLLVSLTINPHLEDYIDDSATNVNTGKCCNATVEILPNAIFEELHLSIFVQRPFVVTPQTQFYNNLSDSTKFNFQVYLEDNTDAPSVDLEVAVSFLTNLGIPKVNHKKTTLPLKLLLENCPPMKESKHKVTLNTNQNTVPLSTLFPEYIGENSLSINSSAIGFQNIGSIGPVVTVLVAKSSQRYRLQSDSLSSLNIVVQETIRRLKFYFSEIADFTISFNSLLPYGEVIEYIRKHFECVRAVSDSQNNLEQVSAQLRLIQKRLVSKFKQKNPTPLLNLDILLQDTNKEIFDITMRLDEEQDKLSKSQINLSCVLHLLVCLLKITDTGNELSSVQEVLSPFVCDIQNQNWEDVIDASLCFLLRTSFAKSEKDKLRAPHASFDEIKDISKLEKHFTQLLERVSKKGPILEANLGAEEMQEEIQSTTEKETVEEISYVGSEIGSSSSRTLSARKSLLRRRQTANE